jgi:cytochrome c oxidase subunit 3
MNTEVLNLPSPMPAPDLARLGMWVFLAGELLFFGVVLVVYGVARVHLPAGFAAASAHTNVWLGTLNTAVLLTSSCAIAIAAEAASWGRERTIRHGLWAAVALGLLFIAIKAIEYHAEWAKGLFPGPGFSIDGHPVAGAELFFAWYFFATALHAMHLAIGIALCADFALRHSWRVEGADGARRVQALALYWHFVDVVWIVLYPLLYLAAPRS